MMLRLTSDVSIDPARVAATEWVRRHYINGSSSTLVVTMEDGRTHRFEHRPGYDPYAIERAIHEALR